MTEPVFSAEDLQKLMAGEDQYHFLVDNLPIGLLLRQEGIVIFCNPEVYRISGYAPEQILGKTLYWLFRDESLEIVKERERKIIANKEKQDTIRLAFPHRDGHMVHIRTVSMYLEYNGRPTIVTLIDDITDQVGTEEQLRLALQVTRTSIWEYFPGRNVFYCSDEIREILGRPELSADQPLAGWLEHIHPDDRQDFAGLAERMNDPREKTAELEWRHELGPGEWVWLYGSFHRVDRGEGEPRWLGILQDINERKKHSLERMIQENLLERTRRMAAMGGLTSAMAHEIRQPLNLIKVLSDTLSYSLSLPEEKRYSPEVLQEKLADISRGVDRINNTISNLRALFNISGRVEREPCDLNNVIRRTLSFYEQRFKAKAITLTMELDDNIPLMNLSPTQVQEILTNLLNNSIDALDGFTPPSGEEKKMCIRTALTPAHAVLRLCDNGPGIPQDHLASLFDPYFSTKTEHDGMGMGLYLVKRMTEEMNGTIRVEKRPEPGAHFLLEFAL